MAVAHHVAVDVAAGRERVQAGTALIACMVRFRLRLMTPWNWNACRVVSRSVPLAYVAGDVVEREPLLGRRQTPPGTRTRTMKL